MYCSKCGSELPPGASFCAQCGSRVWQQPDGPNQAAQPQQQSNPNPYSAAPYSAGQNEVSSRFSPPRPGNPNPFGGMPGGMGQNHSYAPSVSQVEDSGYTRIFGYQKSNIILNIAFTVVIVFFLSWFRNEVEKISYFDRYEGVVGVLGLLIIVEIALAVYQVIHTTKTRLEVEQDGISGRGKVGIAGFIWGTTKDVALSYKDMDGVEPFMSNPNAAIKILSRGESYYFSVENAQEALDLIRQRWQAARR